MTNVSQLDAYRKIKESTDDVGSDALRGRQGGGTLPPMDGTDAKIAAAEARTDTKFAQLRGDLNGQFEKINTALATKPGTGTLIGIAIGIVSVLLAVLALAANRFDAGVSVRGAVESSLANQQERDRSQDRKLDEILNRLPPAG